MTEDPVADQVRRRVQRVTEDAHRLLDADVPERAGVDVEDVARLIATIDERLAHCEGAAEAAAAHAELLERLARRFEARFEALSAVDRALARLRETTAPGAMLSRAPKELCDGSRLTRAVLSLLNDGVIVAEAAHFADDAVAAAKALEQLAASPARLDHPLIDAELLRRRRATIVTDVQVHPRVHRPTAQVMGWHSYVAAPFVVRGDVIGVIHADTGREGRPLDVLDGDVVWAFARGLAGLYETASLRRALRRQREEMRDFVEWLSARSGELADASIELVAERPSPPDPPGRIDALAPAPGVDDRAAFEELLTRRELDVLRLLARGTTNSGIAAELVVSEATVKFHVVNLLRKLRVSNRAEAVARYHRVVRVRREDVSR
jgi:LuxR family transcriptional regulator, regulator of acetate metabolism